MVEAALNQTMMPNKEEVRDWLKRRRDTHEPLPDRDQIQSQLGWKPSPGSAAGETFIDVADAGVPNVSSNGRRG